MGCSLVPNSLKVLAITNDYPTDERPGDAPCIRDQVCALREQGIELDLLVIDRRNKANYAIAAWKVLKMALRKEPYDLVHAYYGHSGLIARMQHKFPVVVTFRGSDLLSRKDGAIGKRVAKLVDGVIVMTEQMKQVSKRKDSHIIPFGVNTTIFIPSSLAKSRSELGLPMGQKLVLFPWNPARPEKRFDIVERAFGHIKQEYKDAQLLTLFGRPHETVAKYMNACDVMILASDREGAPMAVREAIACNLPIVSVDVGDVRRIIGEIDGCYVCTQDVGDLAEKLGRVLSGGNRTDGSRMVTKMDAAWGAQQVVSVYREVVNRRMALTSPSLG